MKAPLSWLREFANLPDSATVAEVAEHIAGVGFEVAGIDGEVMDFEITANRPDCLSVRGLAREAATTYGVQVAALPPLPSFPPIPPIPPIPVILSSPLCARFGLARARVTVGPSPAWLAERLTACGIRPINNIVDITNYVMLEMGQPMHAYDVARLTGPELHARMAHAGEKLTTLDGQTRTLDASMLVIADRDRAVGVAGVMGGATSEVSSSTTDIAIESAYFQPATVRTTSKRLGLKTEASSRFERGADPNGGPASLLRALELIEQIGAGTRVGDITDVYPSPVPTRVVTLQRAHLDRLLGDVVPDANVVAILTSLGFGVTSSDSTPQAWSVVVPTWRVDVAREADLIEEVGRHWGVNRVPATFPALRTPARRSNSGVLRARRIRRLLCGAGLQEAVTFTFIEQAAAAPFVADAASLVSIANPLSEKFAVLRPSMLPGLLDALIYNRRRNMDDVRLFEAGAVFSTAGERQRVGWVLCGARLTHWSQRPETVDLFDSLGVAEIIVNALGAPCHVDASPTSPVPWYERGRFAQLRPKGGGDPIGIVGEIRREWTAARGLPAGVAVIAGEIEISAIAFENAALQKVTPIPRHPSAIRDLSILIDAGLPAASVRATIRAHAPATLVEVREFDRYQGKGIPDGQVSLSVRLTFQDRDRTLTDAEVQQAVEVIVDALAGAHGAALRQ